MYHGPNQVRRTPTAPKGNREGRSKSEMQYADACRAYALFCVRLHKTAISPRLHVHLFRKRAPKLVDEMETAKRAGARLAFNVR